MPYQESTKDEALDMPLIASALLLAVIGAFLKSIQLEALGSWLIKGGLIIGISYGYLIAFRWFKDATSAFRQGGVVKGVLISLFGCIVCGLSSIMNIVVMFVQFY
jgi:hypothetical protein